MEHQSNIPVIVLVDDEDMVVTSIRSFLTLETDYDVKGFTSPSKALEFIQSNRVDVVISDYLMPDLDGISFLAKVKEIQPQATRILLTGYADKENAIKAINDVGLYQYIEKPWENDDLKLIIRNGLEKRLLLKRLEDKIAEVNAAHDELVSLQRDIMKAFA
ncbi:MAG TPA: response regulator [Vicinamibacteria bacterium]|nr:response regulator [Vicinamibacteria bacterium]HXV61527.1 response regulator [Vicinamibacteria bacterium]